MFTSPNFYHREQNASAYSIDKNNLAILGQLIDVHYQIQNDQRVNTGRREYMIRVVNLKNMYLKIIRARLNKLI